MSKAEGQGNFFLFRQQLIDVLEAACKKTLSEFEDVLNKIYVSYTDKSNQLKLCDILEQFLDGNKRSVLYFACYGGNYENAAKIIEIAPKLVNMTDNDSETPLFVSVRGSNVNLIKLLLNNKADVNIRNKMGVIPLHLAAEEGSIEMVELLLNNGSKVNEYSSEMGTPLQLAIIRRHEDVAEILLKNGADPNMISSSPSCRGVFPPPLVFACACNLSRTTKVLLDDGADPKLPDNDGWTALHCAAEVGAVECIQMLLNKGVKDDILTQGKTAFDLAIEHNHHAAAEMLKNADKNT